MANMQNGVSPREAAMNQFKVSRNNLLLMVILTVVNLIMLYFGSENMLLFSASIPYFAVAFGLWWNSVELFAFGLIISVVLIVLYFLCWLLSKKRPGWLTAALVLFILDTLAMVGLFVIAEEISGIIDVLLHGFVLYYLIVGMAAAKRLKKLPPDEEEPAPAEQIPAAEEETEPVVATDAGEEA